VPRLTFSFGPDGLLVPALVNLSAPALQALQAQGSPLPAHVRARGMLDSGSTLTAVAPWVLTTLNATPGRSTQTQTAAGSANVTFYRISFSIYQLLGGGSLLSQVDWLVTSLAEDLADVDVLFGLDLLREIVLTVDGPAGQLTLDF
jgi:hypothetical protein